MFLEKFNFVQNNEAAVQQTSDDIKIEHNNSPVQEDNKNIFDNNWFLKQQTWPWIGLFLISILIVCCILLIITRLSLNSNRKQLSDLDILDSYKQGI